MVPTKNDMKKRRREEPADTIPENPKKAKVHAQRKFAQGAAYNNLSITVIKDKVRPPASVNNPGLVLSAKRPNTEDFLTFLCFRRTSILPPKLDFFKDAFKEQSSTTRNAQKMPNSTATHKNYLTENSTKANTKKGDKNDVQKKIQTPVQALRRKYQEQRLAKQNPTNVTKLAQKVKGKNMVRTRSSTLQEEKTKLIKESTHENDVVETFSGLRSGLQRTSTPTHNHLKKNTKLEIKNLRSRNKSKVVKSNLKAQRTTDKKSPREIALKRNEIVKNVKPLETSSGKVKDVKVNTRKVEGLSDFSSDDNEPLLTVKKGKNLLKAKKLTNGVKEEPITNSVKTRSQLPEIVKPISNTSLRPTRKTKEAAAIYMEMITKKLVSPEKSGDEDRSSIDSFPELPNSRRNEQRESEIKAKAMAMKKKNTKECNSDVNAEGKERSIRNYSALSRKRAMTRKVDEPSVKTETPKKVVKVLPKKDNGEEHSKRPLKEPDKKALSVLSSKKTVKENLMKKVTEESRKKITKECVGSKPTKEEQMKKLMKDEKLLAKETIKKEEVHKKGAKAESVKKPQDDIVKRKMKEEITKKSFNVEISKMDSQEDTQNKFLRSESFRKVVQDNALTKTIKEESLKKSIREEIRTYPEENSLEILAKKVVKEGSEKTSMKEEIMKTRPEELIIKPVKEEAFKKNVKAEMVKKSYELSITKKVINNEANKKVIVDEVKQEQDSSEQTEVMKKDLKEDTVRKEQGKTNVTDEMLNETGDNEVKITYSEKAVTDDVLKKTDYAKKVANEDIQKKAAMENMKNLMEYEIQIVAHTDPSKKACQDDRAKKSVKEDAMMKKPPEEDPRMTKDAVDLLIGKEETVGKVVQDVLRKTENSESQEEEVSVEALVIEPVKDIVKVETERSVRKIDVPIEKIKTEEKAKEWNKNPKEEASIYVKRDLECSMNPVEVWKKKTNLESQKKEEEVHKLDESVGSREHEKLDSLLNKTVKSVSNESEEDKPTEDTEIRPATRARKQEEVEPKPKKASDRLSGVKKPSAVSKRGSSAGSSVPCNSWLPPPGSSSNLLEAPTFYPTEKEFQDPLEFFERIRPAAESFGLCRIVPPSTFKPDCKVSDDMRFTAYNQYVHRMFHRWGPNSKEMMAIKKYLGTQSISLKQPPWIGGIEVDLPRLYQSVQNCGGLMKVMEKKKWNHVADMMRIPKAAQDRVTKLDDIYCKYLLPYDTLSPGERQKLFDEVESDWLKSQESMNDGSGEDSEEEFYIDECEECIVKGRNMALNQFYRIARNTMNMWFRNQEPSPSEVENEFWRHVSERASHVCVHSGSIDSSGWGYGFPVAKNNPFSRHPWNLKVLTNNSGSVLRSLGPVMGVTVPTLHVGMVFTAFCWYRDPHGLPWVEYLHTGAPKIWYGISDDNSSVFKEALTKLLPRYIKNRKIWLPCDTAMVPPALLVEQGVSLCHTIQKPGQFILVFPRAFTSSICTGYLVSESVYFAQPSWLITAEQVFKDIQDCCEPTMFSLEKLLFSIATDSRSSVEVLKQVLPMIWHIKQKEIDGRKTLFNLGLKVSERLPIREQSGSKKKKGRWAQDGEGDYECEVCRTNLCVSLVINSQEEGVFCLPHAIELLTQKRHHLKFCKLMYSYTQEELCDLVQKLEQRIESKCQKKVQNKAATTK